MNFRGQLGNGTNTDSNVPVQVSRLTGVIAIASGNIHCLALLNDGTVRAWGWGLFGELGNGANNSSNTPVQVSGLTGVIAIAGGYDHSLALRNDKTVRTWGSNYSGQLGNGTTTVSNVPVQVTGLTGVITIAGGNQFSLALKDNGTIRTWGSNTSGQLGNGTLNDSNTPIQPTGLCTVLDVEEIAPISSMKVYPNPVNDVLSISSDKQNIGVISVYDQLGRNILKQNIQQKQGKINMQHLPAGVYYLRTEHGREGTRVIKY